MSNEKGGAVIEPCGSTTEFAAGRAAGRLSAFCEVIALLNGMRDKRVHTDDSVESFRAISLSLAAEKVATLAHGDTGNNAGVLA